MDFPPLSVGSGTLTKAVGEPVQAEQPNRKAFSMSCIVATPGHQVSVRSSSETSTNEQTTTGGVVDINKAEVTDSAGTTVREQYQQQPSAPDTKGTDSDTDLEEDDNCPRCFSYTDPRHQNGIDLYDKSFLDNYQLTGEYKLNLHELHDITWEEKLLKAKEEDFIAGDYGEGCNRETRSLYIRRDRQYLEKQMKMAEIEGKYQQRFTEKDTIGIIVFHSRYYGNNIRLKPDVVKKLLDEDPTIFDGMKSPHHLIPGNSNTHSQAARYQPLAKLIANNSHDQSMIFEEYGHSPSCPIKEYSQNSDNPSQTLPDNLRCWSVCFLPFQAYMNQCYEIKTDGYYEWVDFKSMKYELLMKNTREKVFLKNFYRFLFGDESSATPTADSPASNALVDDREKTRMNHLETRFTLLKKMFPPEFDEEFTMDDLMAKFSNLYEESFRE